MERLGKALCSAYTTGMSYTDYIVVSYGVTAFILFGIATYTYLKMRHTKRYYTHLKAMLETDEA